MIKYPDELYLSNYMEHTIGKSRLKSLEKILRKLGSFNKKEPILITEYEITGENRDIILTTVDLNNTKFMFKNFGLDSEIKSTERYRENFTVKMQRKNSNIAYKYDFFNNVTQVIEIEYFITNNKSINLKTHQFSTICLEFIEDNKIYQLVFKDNSEQVKQEIIENFTNILEKYKNVEQLNLLNVLNIIDDIKKISYCHIKMGSKKIATIGIVKGEIWKYELNCDNKEIEVFMKDGITRNIEEKIGKNIIKKHEEKIDGDNQQLKDELNLILKKI